jgi:histidine ammonia-lyase
MGANAATKCFKVIENTQRVLAIELLNAAQALEFRRPLKSSNAVEQLVADYRKVVTYNTVDRALYLDIEASVQFIQQH